MERLAVPLVLFIMVLAAVLPYEFAAICLVIALVIGAQEARNRRQR